MTKTSIFGQPEVKKEEKKPIEFISKLTDKRQVLITNSSPSNWKNVTLLQKNYAMGFDLIWAYDDNPNIGCIYFGDWNDGIVK